MGFYEDMEKSLLEAAEMEKGTIKLSERKNMPAPALFVSDEERVDRPDYPSAQRTKTVAETISRNYGK